MANTCKTCRHPSLAEFRRWKEQGKSDVFIALKTGWVRGASLQKPGSVSRSSINRHFNNCEARVTDAAEAASETATATEPDLASCEASGAPPASGSLAPDYERLLLQNERILKQLKKQERERRRQVVPVRDSWAAKYVKPHGKEHAIVGSADGRTKHKVLSSATYSPGTTVRVARGPSPHKLSIVDKVSDRPIKTVLVTRKLKGTPYKSQT